METKLDHKQFSIRLQEVMKDHQLSAAAFAEKLEVGRATISHLMSGRNKPSLDFVMNVVSTFKTVDLSWLIYGNTAAQNHSSPSSINESKLHGSNVENNPTKQAIKIKNSLTSSGQIKRVILFMEDGTFESYEM